MSAAQKCLIVIYNQVNECQALCYVCGFALFIFDWVQNNLVITAPDTNIVWNLPLKFFIQIVKALMNCKSKAMQIKLKGASHYNTR